MEALGRGVIRALFRVAREDKSVRARRWALNAFKRLAPVLRGIAEVEATLQRLAVDEPYLKGRAEALEVLC